MILNTVIVHRCIQPRLLMSTNRSKSTRMLHYTFATIALRSGPRACVHDPVRGDRISRRSRAIGLALLMGPWRTPRIGSAHA
jgi:hypothetical protein